jgi:hypothetical protein
VNIADSWVGTFAGWTFWSGRSVKTSASGQFYQDAAHVSGTLKVERFPRTMRVRGVIEERFDVISLTLKVLGSNSTLRGGATDSQVYLKFDDSYVLRGRLDLHRAAH